MIYVASSWRNERQPYIVEAIQLVGFDVYDFRNPAPGDTGFHWSEIDEDWQNWRPDQYIQGLDHRLAWEGFDKDFEAMNKAEAFVLVLPCGRSAHLELGWAIGAQVPNAILLDDQPEPELMYKMCDELFLDVDHMIEWLRGL